MSVIAMDKKTADTKLYTSHIELEEFQPLICWKAGLSYGSVIYFEMKDQIFEPALSSYIGSASLWMNGDDWEIYHNGILQSDSEAIGNTDIQLLNSLFLQKKFLSIKNEQESLNIFFEDTEIKVFKTQDDSYDLITFFLPDGGIIYYSDAFYKSFEIDDIRYLYWKEKSGKDKSERKSSLIGVAEVQAV